MWAGGCRRPGSRGRRAAASLALFPSGLCSRLCLCCPSLPGAFGRASGSYRCSFPEPLFRSLSRCSAIETWPHGLGRRRPRSVFLSVCAPVFCVMLYVEWLLAEKQGRIFLSLSTSAVCSSAFQRERWSAYLNC